MVRENALSKKNQNGKKIIVSCDGQLETQPAKEVGVNLGELC